MTKIHFALLFLALVIVFMLKNSYSSISLAPASCGILKSTSTNTTDAIACTTDEGEPTVHLRDLLQRQNIPTSSNFLGKHCSFERHQCRSDVIQYHFSKPEHASYVYAPKHKLLMCYNYKVMSRQVLGFMKNLTNETQNVLTPESEPPLELIVDDPDWLKLMIVRDPMERLLSGYVNKCINDVNSKACRADSAVGRLLPQNHTYRDFVHALESFTKIHQFDGHWKPQSYACMKSPNDDFRVFQMSYSGWQSSLHDLLQRQGVTDTQATILLGKKKSEGYHTNAQAHVAEHYDADLVLRVLRLYSADYITYGLRVPGTCNLFQWFSCLFVCSPPLVSVGGDHAECGRSQLLYLCVANAAPRHLRMLQICT